MCKYWSLTARQNNGNNLLIILLQVTASHSQHGQGLVLDQRQTVSLFACMATTEIIMVLQMYEQWELEHRRNEEILEEASIEPIAMVTRRLEWFGHVNR